MSAPSQSDLAGRLAAEPGVLLRRKAPLAPLTTFGIGGPAELLVEVARLAALRATARAAQEAGVPLLLLGLGSNLLVPDAGLAGLVVRLTGGFARYRFSGPRVVAGGAVPLPRLARRSARRGLAGLEALCGFPSTVGGAVVMNAGSYGAEIKDVLVRATVVEPGGGLRRLNREQLEPAYRTTSLQGTGAIVARVSLELRPGDAGGLRARIGELDKRRRASLPGGRGNAGSIFKNPPGDHAGRLIEAAGLKAERLGTAQISPKHANVIVNLGGASASDVLELMLAARRSVLARFGVALEPEIVLVGELGRRWRQAVESAGPAEGQRGIASRL